MRFVGTNGDLVPGKVKIVYLEVGEFGNTHPCLEKKLNNGSHTNVFTAGVTKGSVFELGEDAGWFDVIFGMSNVYGRIVGDVTGCLHVREESLDGVDLAGDGLGGVTVVGKFRLESVNVFFFEFTDSGLSRLGNKVGQLLYVFRVG